MMTIIQAKSENDLTLGRQGENLARQVVFDLSAWEAEYGPGVAELIHQRPGDAAPYPVAAVREGGTLVWTLTSADTDFHSDYGSCELRYYVGDVLVKSRTWLTKVIRAMSTPSETAPPEPEQGWVDQIIAVGAAAKASADAAKADADRAAELAAQAAEKAAQTAQDASDAAKAMEAAQTAQRLAEEAQGAAETARTAAAAAQAAAETAATDAAGAKQAAETAQKAAQDAAAAAAQALSDIKVLYQQMQTWAQSVIQDVNDAGSVAVQSVQTAGDAQVQRVTDEGTTQTANAKAQADAAAQSADSAAQSAQQAEESAAVYDDVVSDVTQLKHDLNNQLLLKKIDPPTDDVLETWALSADPSKKGLYSNANYKTIRYPVVGGELIKLKSVSNITNLSLANYQFQTEKRITTTEPNLNVIGSPYVEQFDGYVTVPTEATWIYITMFNDDTESGLYNSYKFDEIESEMENIESEMENIEKNVDNILNQTDEVFDSEVSSVVSEIQGKTTSKALLFCAITDSHIDSNRLKYFKKTIENARKVCSAVSFDNIVHLGDMIDGADASKETGKQYLAEGTKALLSVNAKRTCILKGNHEDNDFAGTEYLLSETELYGCIQRINENEVVRRGLSSDYYYDEDNFKIR